MIQHAGDGTANALQAPWWKGTRGEWYVLAQIPLMALILFGPRTWPGAGRLSFPYPQAWSVAALALIVAGGSLIISGGLWLGRRNLTALPRPRDEARLVETGPYRLVRHPIYAGGIVFSLGWSIWVRGPLTFAYTLALVVLMDVKSRHEERWLMARFPGYAAYRTRVRKLIPFVY
jgi:protein-S-isoprenylcysteine O-methyltransferase Ste14